MPRSKSRKKIYFYLFILLLLSSTFNFNIISKFKKSILISHINIVGLNEKEKNNLEKSLKIFMNKNIFFISKDEVLRILKKNNFLDSYNIVKIFPSKIFIYAKKTEFVGKTIFDSEKFYIGKNGKLTKVSLVEKEYNLPLVFGNFQVQEFLEIQEILNKNGFNLDEIKNYYYYKSNRWDIENNDNVVLKLPSQNIEKSLKDYRSLIKTNKITQNQLIDLRMRNKIIFTDAKK